MSSSSRRVAVIRCRWPTAIGSPGSVTSTASSRSVCSSSRDPSAAARSSTSCSSARRASFPRFPTAARCSGSSSGIERRIAVSSALRPRYLTRSSSSSAAPAASSTARSASSAIRSRRCEGVVAGVLFGARFRHGWHDIRTGRGWRPSRRSANRAAHGRPDVGDLVAGGHDVLGQPRPLGAEREQHGTAERVVAQGAPRPRHERDRAAARLVPTRTPSADDLRRTPRPCWPARPSDRTGPRCAGSARRTRRRRRAPPAARSRRSRVGDVVKVEHRSGLRRDRPVRCPAAPTPRPRASRCRGIPATASASAVAVTRSTRAAAPPAGRRALRRIGHGEHGARERRAQRRGQHVLALRHEQARLLAVRALAQLPQAPDPGVVRACDRRRS